MQFPKLNTFTPLKSFELLLRLYLAYILISNSYIGFLTDLKDLGMPEHIYNIINGMWETGFMMHLVKLTELVTGIMILFNFFVPLALIALIPVVVNIYGIHIFLFDSYLTKGLAMLCICLFLVYQHREKYKPLIQRN